MIAASEMMGLRVAELGLWLDARGTGLRLVAPPVHAKFLEREPVEPLTDRADLVLYVRNAPPTDAGEGQALLCQTEIWELWQDQAGRYVFVAPRQSPPRQIVIDADFTIGEVLGDFSSNNGEGLYPLQSLDIRLFANWLASYGDVILHAAGVMVNGQGYCFAGPPGAGKSTLAASLMSAASREAAETATANVGVPLVLGEDQVVLRYLEGRFWIYGTPWHIDPTFCAPLKAPLAKIFLLDRTALPGVRPCAAPAGVACLLQTAFIPYYRPAAVAAILERLALLAEQVPFYTFSYQLGANVLGLIGDV